MIAAALHSFSFASPTPGDFFSQYLPTSGFASIDFAGPLLGEGHINGQVTNQCHYPIYVRQAVAEFSGVTGEKCKHFGETKDVKIDPGRVYISERPTYYDGCGTLRKPAF